MNTRGFQRFLSYLGIIGRAPTNTADTTVGAATLTGAAVVGGSITRTGSTAAYTDTFPTITNLVSALPIGQLEIGMAWELKIRNNTAWIETLAAGTGGTLSGITVVPPYSTLTALVTISSTTAYTVVGLSVAPILTNFTEVVTTTNVIAASENGATFFLALANGFTSTLPPPAMGLQYRFIVQIAPTTAYIIVPTTGNIIFGSSHSAAGGASGLSTTGEGTFTFVASQSTVGDRADFISDGTNWYVISFCSVDAAITIA